MPTIRRINDPSFDAEKAFGVFSDNHGAEMSTEGILSGMGTVEKDFEEQGIYDELKKHSYKTSTEENR